jgi:hypothetical protein
LVISVGYCARVQIVDAERREMAKAVTIYGIKNCDTMMKARARLGRRGAAYSFQD